MQNTKILIILFLFSLSTQKASAQDVTFSQWEHLPQFFNPALTGNFEGTLKFRAKHRNQWQSVLGKNSYRTTAASAEYKFKTGEKRQFSLGFYTLFDKAGASEFSTKTYNLSTSIVQKLNTRHSIAIGFNAGLGKKSINLDNLQWGTGGQVEPEDFNSKVTYGDLSVGLNWRYVTKTHFAFHIGAALLHLNKPNTSFTNNGNSTLPSRFNLHGNVEVPITDNFSLVPSMLYSKQDISDQLLFGLYNKWYLNPRYARSVQLGIFAKTTPNFFGIAENVYVASISLELKSMLFGFSFDRFQGIGSNAFEFSGTYTLGAP